MARATKSAALSVRIHDKEEGNLSPFRGVIYQHSRDMIYSRNVVAVCGGPASLVTVFVMEYVELLFPFLVFIVMVL